MMYLRTLIIGIFQGNRMKRILRAEIYVFVFFVIFSLVFYYLFFLEISLQISSYLNISYLLFLLCIFYHNYSDMNK